MTNPNRVGAAATISNVLILAAGIATGSRIAVAFGLVGTVAGIGWAVSVIRRNRKERTR